MHGALVLLVGLGACLADEVTVEPLGTAKTDGEGKIGVVSEARLGQVVLDVCDHDKNFGLTLYEVNITLMAIAKSMPLPSPELKDIVRQARRVTPTIFRIVDEDNDEEVTGKELLWVSEMYDLLKEKPVLKGLSNALFTVLDTDADDGLSAEEIRAAIQTDGVVEKLIAIFDERFPVRARAPLEPRPPPRRARMHAPRRRSCTPSVVAHADPGAQARHLARGAARQPAARVRRDGRERGRQDRTEGVAEGGAVVQEAGGRHATPRHAPFATARSRRASWPMMSE